MTDELLAVADAFCKARGLSRSRVSTIIFNDGKKLNLVAGGADLQTGKFEHAMLWFASNWPEGAAWPSDIARPSSTVSVRRAS